jgi:hypothetical protein
MKVGEARQRLSRANHKKPAVLTRSVLSKLTVEDVPEGVTFIFGTRHEELGVTYLDWGGSIAKGWSYSPKR